MIVRAIAITSLLCVLLTVLYLPAAHRPEHFLQQLRIEHDLAVEWWGHDHALRVLAAMLDWHDVSQQVSPLPRTFTSETMPEDHAVGTHLTHMAARVAANPYFASLDALVALATYRGAGLLHWLPVVLVFVGAALCDGAMVRIVKSSEFRQHAPERYALYAAAAFIAGCGVVIVLVIPFTVHPVWLVALPVITGSLAGRAVADFHRHGR